MTSDRVMTSYRFFKMADIPWQINFFSGSDYV